MKISGARFLVNKWSFFGLSAFVAVAVLPLLAGLVYATAYSLGLAGLLADGFTLDHWLEVVRHAEVWASFGISLYVAGATTACCTVLAMGLALRLRGATERGPLSYALYVPLALPATVAAFFVFQLFTDAGLLARFAALCGWLERPNQFPAMVHDPWMVGVIAAHLLLAVPYFTLYFSQVYETENLAALTHLTRALGGSAWDCVWRVVLPVMWHKGLTQLLLLFISVLGSYEIPLLLGRQSPQMLSVLTLRKYQMFDLAQKPEAFIVALLYTFFVLALLVTAFRRGRMVLDA